jgi:hypothetical protein
MKKNNHATAKDSEEQTANPNSQQWVQTLPGTDPHNSSTFYKLTLSKLQYETLKKHGGSMLVFQFYYPKESHGGSPTLYAYNMQKERQPTQKPPAILSYDEASEEPLWGRSQVLGDQQIEISRLERLIKNSIKNTKGDFKNLVFTPVFLPENPHVAFKISVDDAGDSETANPSPPG